MNDYSSVVGAQVKHSPELGGCSNVDQLADEGSSVLEGFLLDVLDVWQLDL